MPYVTPYGTLTGRDQVVQAVLSLLSQPPVNESTGGPAGAQPLLVYLLAEVERQRGLIPYTIPTPPGVASYRPGLDWETWKADDLPGIGVVVQPIGDAVRLEMRGPYVQSYQIQVGAIVENTDGDQEAVERLADYYGTAVMGVLMKNGNLGTRTIASGATEPFALTTVLTSAPRTEFQDVTTRRFARSVTIAQSLVSHIVDERGPVDYPSDPYAVPGAWPLVEMTNAAVDAQPI